MILIAPGTILAMTPKLDLLGGPTKENARTLLSPDGSNGPYKDPKNHAHVRAYVPTRTHSHVRTKACKRKPSHSRRVIWGPL